MSDNVKSTARSAQSPLVFVLDGVEIPDDHSVFKLFPGRTYSLARAMHESHAAFLDIHGLTDLKGQPSSWADADILRVISFDRISRDGGTNSKKPRKRPASEQDQKRLGFLKSLFFSAKKGDLVVVPLGKGYDSKIVIGELLDDAGDIRKISYSVDDGTVENFGRRVKWLEEIYRHQLSAELRKSIQSPTAFHLAPNSTVEEVYTVAYGTFCYKGIYVAKFSSDKEVFSAQDYANIGVLFNGISVIHDHPPAGAIGFYDLAIEGESAATIEIRRNSPISVILRTVGPLAFSAAVFFSAAEEGKAVHDLKNVAVEVRSVGSAAKKCKIEVPPDVADAAVGFGIDRYKTFCGVRKKVAQEATVRTPAHLKKLPKGSK